MSCSDRVIIYVPGMKPKPPAELHHPALWRAMKEGIRRSDPAVAKELEQADCLQLISWTWRFYRSYYDFSLDQPGIDRIFSLAGPEEADIAEAMAWHKKLARLTYMIMDAFPFLIGLIANQKIKATLAETRRYFRNEHGIATRIRRMVIDALTDAWSNEKRVLLIGHSLGSVIAYDALWELSRRADTRGQVDLFLTLGSPLGLNFVKKGLLGTGHQEEMRYPTNIRRWKNLSAVGELTALDRSFADDFSEMVDLGLVESIEDQGDLFNFFRGPDGLNVHKCYGYLINVKVGATIAEWWRASPVGEASSPE